MIMGGVVVCERPVDVASPRAFDEHLVVARTLQEWGCDS